MIRKIVSEEYGTGPGGLSGNEDAGQMSAWLVCSMMGFYPVCPGKPEYVLGIPSFDEIVIQPENNRKSFVIRSVKESVKIPESQSITLNGKPIVDFVLKHDQVVKGGELIFKSMK